MLPPAKGSDTYWKQLACVHEHEDERSGNVGVRGGGVSHGSNRMVLWGPFQWLMVSEEAHAAKLPQWEP